MDKLTHCILLGLQHQVISTSHRVRGLEEKAVKQKKVKVKSVGLYESTGFWLLI